ncbi:MAG TPA: phosphatidate cytidylyltransferase [Longimicrobiales bacterium]|nr:phosphatidate cytidylyltransferase [Longimicrobiales bacterium]
MASELTKRVAVAAVGVPLAIVILYIGGWVIALALAVLAAAGAAEFYRLARERGVRPFVVAGIVLAALPVLLTMVTPDAEMWAWRAFVAAAIVIAAAAIFRRGVAGAPLAVMAVTVFAAMFTGGTLLYAMLLRLMPVPGASAEWQGWVGPALLAFPMTLTWMGDTFAYFGGRALGRRKLIPAVSPAKTVEGALTGVIGTTIVGALYAHFIFGAWLGVPVGAGTGALIGLIVSPVAQIGDLAESLLKREAGVKDSGTLLPGHGGVLDRFDALFFSIPVTYWLLMMVL